MLPNSVPGIEVMVSGSRVGANIPLLEHRPAAWVKPSDRCLQIVDELGHVLCEEQLPSDVARVIQPDTEILVIEHDAGPARSTRVTSASDVVAGGSSTRPAAAVS